MSEKPFRNLTLWLALVLLGIALVVVGACGQTPEPTEEPEPTAAPTAEPEPTAAPDAEPGEVLTPTEGEAEGEGEGEEGTPEGAPDVETATACKPGDQVAPCVTVDDGGATEWKIVEQGDGIATADGLVFVEDEVIVMGPQVGVLEVVREVLGNQAADDFKYLVPLTNLLPTGALARLGGKWDFIDWEDDPLVLGSFPILDETPLTEIVSDMYDYVGGVYPFFAEANLFTGNPHTWAGSPHTWAGSEPGVEGVPASQGFWEQWAFKDVPGIDLVEAGQDGWVTRRKLDEGDDIQIAVFDSLPFTRTDGAQIMLVTPAHVEVDWITPTLDLTVYRLLPQATEEISPADHGLFVSGLAHAVAPGSNIRLIQVLSDNLTGTLDNINYGILFYMDQRLVENGGTMNNTVMNFSLGFPISLTLPFSAGSILIYPPEEQIYGLFLQLVFGYEVELWPVPSLYFLTLLSDYHDAALVAAAGNDTEDTLDEGEVPAAYPEVLSVEASGAGGQRTCYSRDGTVAAPGGDPAPPEQGEGHCPERLAEGCAGGMVSLAYRTSLCTGYACWIGSSFATPLVSGEVAIKFQQCGGTIPVTDLHTAVLDGALVTTPDSVPIIYLPKAIGSLKCK